MSTAVARQPGHHESRPMKDCGGSVVEAEARISRALRKLDDVLSNLRYGTEAVQQGVEWAQRILRGEE